MFWEIIILSLVLVLLILYLFWERKHHQDQLVRLSPGQDSLQLMGQQVEGLREQMRAHLESSASLLQKQISDLNSRVNEGLTSSAGLLNEGHKNVGERLDRAAKVIGELQKQLGSLQESHEELRGLKRDFSDFKEIFKSPKLRGNFGEMLLEQLLSQVLPPDAFTLQYAFSNQEKVDAIIRQGERLVSVDAKFPLENFSRYLKAESQEEKNEAKKNFVNDVKKHVESIHNKYIRPNEGTYDFALMYIPAENVYYEILIRDEMGAASATEHRLRDFCFKKRVLPVSPNTFYVYLNTLALGLKGMRIEKQSREILEKLSRLSRDLIKLEEALRKTGLHLGNAQGAWEEANKRLDRFSGQMEKLVGQGEEKSLEIPQDSKEALSLVR
ncbi:MAG: DNA recombination protein RmuC [Deltaproteobacteria bacterium]|nr:DNA recombination protein RmuC [Deltaproteobacteria bacterium]